MLRPARVSARYSSSGLKSRAGRRLKGWWHSTASVSSGAEVVLSSDRPEFVALPMSVRVQAGERAGEFPVETRRVLAPMDVTIRASRDGIERIAALKLVPVRDLGTPRGNGPDPRPGGFPAGPAGGQPGAPEPSGQPAPCPEEGWSQ